MSNPITMVEIDQHGTLTGPYAVLSCPECSAPRMRLLEAWAGYRPVLLVVCERCGYEEES